jgi:hypothetical protein
LLEHTLGAAIRRKHAALHLRQAERRVRRRNADVRRQEERHASTEAEPVHGRDDGLPDLKPAIE